MSKTPLADNVRAPRPAQGPAPTIVRHAGGAVTIFHHGHRCVSLNDERGKHWTQRWRNTDEVRQTWGWLLKSARLPHMAAVTITVTAGYKGQSQDPGNCYPSAKAAIDALKDVGVIDDDNGNVVRHLGFQVDMEARSDYLSLTIKEVKPQ